MTLERRIERLERQNRRLKRAGGLALLAAASIVLMGQGFGVSEELRAKKLVLVNDELDPQVLSRQEDTLRSAGMALAGNSANAAWLASKWLA